MENIKLNKICNFARFCTLQIKSTDKNADKPQKIWLMWHNVLAGKLFVKLQLTKKTAIKNNKNRNHERIQEEKPKRRFG